MLFFNINWDDSKLKKENVTQTAPRLRTITKSPIGPHALMSSKPFQRRYYVILFIVRGKNSVRPEVNGQYSGECQSQLI